MSFQERGVSLQSNLINLGRDVWDWGETQLVIRRTFKTSYANWLANLIAKDTAHPLVPQCLLKRIQVQQGAGGIPGTCLVNLTFKQEAPLSGENPPADRYSENPDAVRVSIFESPYFASLAGDSGDYSTEPPQFKYAKEYAQTGSDAAYLSALSGLDGADLALMQELLSYISKGTTEIYAEAFSVTKTEFDTAPFDTPENRVARKENPGGGYGDPGQWLILGCYRGREGPWHTRNTVYQHSAEEIPPFYQDA